MLHDGEGKVIECQSTFQHHRAPPVCVAPQPCSEELRRSLTVAEGLHPWTPSSVFLPTKQANKKFDSDYRFASAAAVTEQSSRLRRPLPRHPGKEAEGVPFPRAIQGGILGAGSAGVGTFGSKDLEHAEGDTIIDRVRKIGRAGIRGMLKGLEELLKSGSETRVSYTRSRVWDFKLHGTEEAELRGEEAEL
jgi:hypothetical protein